MGLIKIMKIKISIIIIFFLVSCLGISFSALWNPNYKSKKELAYLKLENSRYFRYHIVKVDGFPLSKPWLPGKDVIKISTGNHKFTLALIKSASFFGRKEYVKEKIILNSNKILKPGILYKLKIKSNLLIPKSKTILLLEEKFFKHIIHESWSITSISLTENKWKLSK